MGLTDWLINKIDPDSRGNNAGRNLPIDFSPEKSNQDIGGVNSKKIDVVGSPFLNLNSIAENTERRVPVMAAEDGKSQLGVASERDGDQSNIAGNSHEFQNEADKNAYSAILEGVMSDKSVEVVLADELNDKAVEASAKVNDEIVPTNDELIVGANIEPDKDSSVVVLDSEVVVETNESLDGNDVELVPADEMIQVAEQALQGNNNIQESDGTEGLIPSEQDVDNLIIPMDDIAVTSTEGQVDGEDVVVDVLPPKNLPVNQDTVEVGESPIIDVSRDDSESKIEASELGSRNVKEADVMEQEIIGEVIYRIDGFSKQLDYIREQVEIKNQLQEGAMEISVLFGEVTEFWSSLNEQVTQNREIRGHLIALLDGIDAVKKVIKAGK